MIERWLIVSLCACAAPRDVAVTSPEDVPHHGAVTPHEPPAAPTTATVPTIHEDQVACRIGGATLPSTLALWLGPNGPAIGHARAVYEDERQKLIVPRGSRKQSPQLDVEAPAASYRVHVDPASLQITARAPVLIAGIVAPMGDTLLTWTKAQKDVLVVGYRLSAGARTTHLQALVPCDDLTFSKERFHTRQIIDDLLGANLQYGYLKAAPNIGIAATPKGKPVASLDLPADLGVRIAGGNGQAQRLRIALPQNDEVVIGWVDQGAVRIGGTRSRRARPPRVRMGRYAKDVTALRCAQGRPMIVEYNGMRTAIGRIAPKTPIIVKERKDGVANIAVVGLPLALTAPARIVLDEDQLKNCEPITVRI